MRQNAALCGNELSNVQYVHFYWLLDAFVAYVIFIFHIRNSYVAFVVSVSLYHLFHQLVVNTGKYLPQKEKFRKNKLVPYDTPVIF